MFRVLVPSGPPPDPTRGNVVSGKESRLWGIQNVLKARSTAAHPHLTEFATDTLFTGKG